MVCHARHPALTGTNNPYIVVIVGDGPPSRMNLGLSPTDNHGGLSLR